MGKAARFSASSWGSCGECKMAILSQEIVDYLNRAEGSGLGEWLKQNPVMRNFVTSPYISLRPTAIPLARRITIYEDSLGRYVHLNYRDNSHRYIFDVQNWDLTVADVEDLIREVDGIGGDCHVERAYLIVFVPSGYELLPVALGEQGWRPGVCSIG